MDERWAALDEAYAADEPRNAFVVPYLTDDIQRLRPHTVIDVGGRTGHVLHWLVERSPGVNRWVMVDARPECARHARRLLPTEVEVVCAEVPPVPGADRPGLYVFFSYTAMEMEAASVEVALSHLRVGSAVAIVVPDILEDVGAQLPDLLAHDHVIISKEVERPLSGQIFIAHRMEWLLEVLTSLGYSIVRFARYRCTDGRHQHHALTAVRQTG